jgi:hypothetical protein
MVTITNYNNVQPFQKSINKHKNMLIIGEAATNYKLNEISYQSSVDAVNQLYGSSQLSDAFSIAKRLGVPDVFLINVGIQTDYIDLVDVIKQYDFTYIVPLGIKFSDTFFNPILNRPMSYSELYLDSVGQNGNALILMTDCHASLYEDVDSFLDDMRDKITSFKYTAQSTLRNGRNMCLVANNLNDYDFANLMAACAICVSAYSVYPTAEFGAAIFDIDDLDIGNLEMCYFKNNTLVPTSIENLKNFRIENDSVKLINIDRVIKFIERELDLSEFKGKFFNDYIKLKIYTKLTEFFKGIVNIAISDFNINSIEFVTTTSGAGSIINKFTLQPINSIESFDIAMEV